MKITGNVKPSKRLFAKRPLKSISSRRIEASSAGKLVDIDRKSHPLVQAATIAFDEHLPLRLYPDSIWTTLVQGFALHLQKNQKADFGRKQTLQIERHDFIMGSADNPWSQVIEGFSEQILRCVGEFHSLVVPEFSTTTPDSKAASAVSLMQIVSGSFDYRVVTKCGFPSIEIDGTSEDWRNIDRRLEQWNEFGLEWWTTQARSVIGHIIDILDGHDGRDFLENFYKFQQKSGGDEITGYINKLFPYLEGTRNQFQEVRSNQYPYGLSSVKFVWNYTGKTFEYEFLGGFLGIEQDAEGTIQPHVGWAVAT